MPQQKTDIPLVSVIVPCYNSGFYLAEALNSMSAQTYGNWECIIIDDGSTDNSKEIALAYAKKDKRFKYIHQENQGVSVARNNAITNSSGKYILPLDADDKISAQYLAEAVKVMEARPEVKVTYCKAKLFGKKTGLWNIVPYSYKQLLIENPIFCTALFRREDFNKTTGYDKNMIEGFEDWDFWISFLKETDVVYQIPKIHFYYRIKDISRNTELDAIKQKQLRQRIYEKHKELYDKYFSISNVIYDHYTVSSALNSVNTSATFKIGKMIMWPYRFIRKIFK